MSDTARRYITLIQAEGGYPPPGEPPPAPPEGPIPPTLHTVVLASDYEDLLAERDALVAAIGAHRDSIAAAGRVQPGNAVSAARMGEKHQADLALWEHAA
jgi:hypothetical protein